MSWKGITDLTTTEGDIRNFTRICHLIKKGGMAENRLIELTRKDQTIRRTNTKVIKRHLSILVHLKLISKDREFYTLDSYGKMLRVLTGNEDLSKPHPTELEKILYFVVFLTRRSLPQLALLLYTMSRNPDLSRDEIIYRYYEDFLATRIILWDRTRLRRRLQIYKTRGESRRPESNRFDCMRYWLEHLGLVSKYRLTEAGTRFVEFEPLGDLKSVVWSEYKEKISEHIFYLCTFALNTGSFSRFNPDYEVHYMLFRNYLRDAYRLFGNRTLKTLGSAFMEKWIPINLLWHNKLYFLRSNTQSLIADLYRKKVIESVIPGDYRGERLIKIAEGRI